MGKFSALVLVIIFFPFTNIAQSSSSDNFVIEGESNQSAGDLLHGDSVVIQGGLTPQEYLGNSPSYNHININNHPFCSDAGFEAYDFCNVETPPEESPEEENPEPSTGNGGSILLTDPKPEQSPSFQDQDPRRSTTRNSPNFIFNPKEIINDLKTQPPPFSPFKTVEKTTPKIQPHSEQVHKTPPNLSSSTQSNTITIESDTGKKLGVSTSKRQAIYYYIYSQFSTKFIILHSTVAFLLTLLILITHFKNEEEKENKKTA